MTDDEDNNDRW